MNKIWMFKMCLFLILAITLSISCTGEDSVQIDPSEEPNKEGLSFSPSENNSSVSDQTITAREDTSLEGIDISRKWIGEPLNTYLVIALIDLETISIRPTVMGVTSKSPYGLSISGAIRQKNVVLVVGSGFVSSYSPISPVGLLIIDGVTVNPILQSGLSTIVFVRNRKLNMISEDLFEPDGVTGAFQTGPRLIQNGVLVISSDEPIKKQPHTRGFIGIRDDGKYIVGLTENRVYLYHLAQYLITPLEDGEPACKDAVNLSGGSAEGLAIRMNDKIINYGNTTSRQASMVAFLKTQQEGDAKK